jgi:hypothetical protein
MRKWWGEVKWSSVNFDLTESGNQFGTLDGIFIKTWTINGDWFEGLPQSTFICESECLKLMNIDVSFSNTNNSTVMLLNLIGKRFGSVFESKWNITISLENCLVDKIDERGENGELRNHQHWIINPSLTKWNRDVIYHWEIFNFLMQWIIWNWIECRNWKQTFLLLCHVWFLNYHNGIGFWHSTEHWSFQWDHATGLQSPSQIWMIF